MAGSKAVTRMPRCLYFQSSNIQTLWFSISLRSPDTRQHCGWWSWHVAVIGFCRLGPGPGMEPVGAQQQDSGPEPGPETLSHSLSWFSTSDLVMQSMEPATPRYYFLIKSPINWIIQIMLFNAIFELVGLNVGWLLVVFSVCMYLWSVLCSQRIRWRQIYRWREVYCVYILFFSTFV